MAGAVGEKEVEQAVAIIIEGGDASHDGFNLVPGGGGGVVQYDIQAGARARIFKRYGERRGGGLYDAGHGEKHGAKA